MTGCRIVCLTAIALLLGIAAEAATLPAVFDGDPVDLSTGAPYAMLPGVALVLPGPNGRFGDGDDIIDPSKVGDVDLVIRAGSYAGGAIPAPASGVAAALPVTAGGGHTGVGTGLPFAAILSDGAASPPAGNPLLDHELDDRGLIVFAYGDLDGDGFIGPTSADGNTDNQIELQEAYAPIGRQVALFANGIASGSIGVSAGAPGSAGGLGVVLAGGAFTGQKSPSYSDGTWIATRLPFMPPLDPKDIVGSSNIRPPDPEYLVDLELNLERIFLPPPDDPILGTPYALPLDGSNATIDLARSEAGPAVGAAIALPVDVATFSADPARQLIPAVGPEGSRQVLEAAAILALADDGPGNAKTVMVYLADVFGNAADPSSVPTAVTVEVSAGLRLASPDLDGDPQRETLQFDSAAAIAVQVDDDGGAGDSGNSGYVATVVAGVPTATLRVALTGSGSGAEPLAPPLTVLRFASVPGKDRLVLRSDLDAVGIDPAADEVSITLAVGGSVIYERTFAAGTLQVTSLRRWVYREKGASLPGGATIVLRSLARRPGAYRLRARIRNLDLAGIDANVAQVLETLRVGSASVSQTLTCAPNRRGTVSRCAP